MSLGELTATIRGNYRVEMKTREHALFADEPLEVGGTDTAAKPGELVLASLAGCKLITMRMYAERKGWDIGETRIELRYLEKGDTTIVEKKIHFAGNVTEEQKERLTEISGRCPVAKMLSKSIQFQLA